jgi:hypothetical protein
MELEAFTWPLIEDAGGTSYGVVTDYRKITSFWKGFPQEAIGVFIYATFPPGIRMGKVDLEP